MPLIRFREQIRHLATHDFAPEFSAKVRGLFYNPLGVLILACGVSFLCGLFLHAQGFVLCGGIAGIIVLGVIWPWLTLRGIVGTIDFAQTRSSEGDAIPVLLRLQNRLPWPAWGLAVRGGFGGNTEETIVGISSAPRQKTALCRWSITVPYRGVYPQKGLRLTSGFPFGLWDNSRSIHAESRLVVWPRTFSVGPIPPVSGAHQVEGNVSRSKVGSHGDVLGVRPYRRGDSPRRIHWGQSARHDRLIVCELQSNSRPMIQIVLDLDPLVHTGTGTNSSREWAIRIVASFAKGWLEDGAQVGLAWAGLDIPAASGPTQIHKILDALAELPGLSDQPLAEVLACPKCRGFRDGLQVIVTTDRSEARSACMACSSEDQRWVILQANGFKDHGEKSSSQHFPAPWLLMNSPSEVPGLLKGGWREAKHGS